MTESVSIRMSGLGGQGVVTAAHILGVAAFKEGLEVRLSPFFGAEKRLAPAESYVRISKHPINERGEVLYPDVIMIFHPHVITMGKCYTMPFYDGLRQSGTILVNSPDPLPLDVEDQENLSRLNAQVHYLPATSLARETGGTELSTNIAMLGGLLGVQPVVSLESMEASMMERFGGSKFVASGTTSALDDKVKEKYAKLSQMIEKNMEMLRSAAALTAPGRTSERVHTCTT